MIAKISLRNVASYKQNAAILETDKKINLIYGLNGTGKSTFSKYFQNVDNHNYNDCSIEPELDGETELLVYNQQYIESNFYNSPSQKGIFSLSKGNKEAQESIDRAKKKIDQFLELQETINEQIESLRNDIANQKDYVKKKIWKIKANYSGGDRILYYCLEGHMRSKDDLFSFINSIERKKTEVLDLERIKEEVYLLKNNENKINNLDCIQFRGSEIEKNLILEKAIVSSGNSNFSQFIKRIENSDWVKSGIKYISDKNSENKCPFCQQLINKEELLKELTNSFDDSYKNEISNLNRMIVEYDEQINSLIEYSIFKNMPLLKDLKDRYLRAYTNFKSCLDKNYSLLKEKAALPSKTVVLLNSSDLLDELNKIIIEANILITDFNKKIDKKEENLIRLKNEFWNNMRIKYDPLISNFNKENSIFDEKMGILNKKLTIISSNIQEQKREISEKEKLVVNIEEAIEHINQRLIFLGIDNFLIEPQNGLYRIKRGDDDSDSVFKSLSEGEKMIISFLYFIEECKGKKIKTEIEKRKIVLIDDPISSLSQIYVFNIGRLIHEEFLRCEKYEQIFILTHSLYFFYELTDINKERRENNQALFRITKNKNGSSIEKMKYEEIQNDYHAYWKIIKDEHEPAALIANCMRNIIDYFFNFIEKKDYNNVFQKPELQNNKFQAFNRYMNRESHSLGQNIFDIKEFDYNIWKEAFKFVFDKTNYLEHYKRMMR